MDREIIFRGKRLDNGEWVEGFYEVHPDGKAKVLRKCDNPPDNDPMWRRVLITYEVDPKTVCWYTTYADIRGHKAFERDIVFYEDCGCYGNIVFKNGQFLIEWKSRPDLRNDIHFWFTKRRIHVVGNIFDNPELLEGGES